MEKLLIVMGHHQAYQVTGKVFELANPVFMLYTCYQSLNQANLNIDVSRLSVGSGSSGDTDIQYIKPSELFPKKPAWVEGGSGTSTPPFPLLPGEDIAYEVLSFNFLFQM